MCKTNDECTYKVVHRSLEKVGLNGMEVMSLTPQSFRGGCCMLKKTN